MHSRNIFVQRLVQLNGNNDEFELEEDYNNPHLLISIEPSTTPILVLVQQLFFRLIKCEFKYYVDKIIKCVFFRPIQEETLYKIPRENQYPSISVRSGSNHKRGRSGEQWAFLFFAIKITRPPLYNHFI